MRGNIFQTYDLISRKILRLLTLFARLRRANRREMMNLLSTIAIILILAAAFTKLFDLFLKDHTKKEIKESVEKFWVLLDDKNPIIVIQAPLIFLASSYNILFGNRCFSKKALTRSRASSPMGELDQGYTHGRLTIRKTIDLMPRPRDRFVYQGDTLIKLYYRGNLRTLIFDNVMRHKESRMLSYYLNAGQKNEPELFAEIFEAMERVLKGQAVRFVAHA